MDEIRETDDEPNARVEQKSEELIREFRSHLERYQAKHPEADVRRVYEGWAIQKIAGLQVSVLELAEHLNILTEELKTWRS